MIRRLLPFLTLIVLFVFLAVASPYFLTSTNLSSVVRQTAVINTMALGMTMIIVAGGIDLSVGAILAFSGFVGTMIIERGISVSFTWLRIGSLQFDQRWVILESGSIVAGIAVGLVAGLFWGFVNGFLTTRLNINPFIVTLGTLGIVRGLTLIISNGLPVHRVPQEFSYLGAGNLLGVPFVLWILVVCALVTHVLLEHTRLGRYAFAIGSNTDAAFYTGVPVAFHTIAVYAISGLLCGLAGMIEASRLMTGQPTAGQGYELQVIAAVVIGGGSLRGGEGSVIGTLIGAFIMGLLSNGSDLLGISPYLQQAIIGAVIILAVSVDELRKRRLG
jgi:ribose transport system permease protein